LLLAPVRLLDPLGLMVALLVLSGVPPGLLSVLLALVVAPPRLVTALLGLLAPLSRRRLL